MAKADADQDGKLETTALTALHRELGAKLVPFAGYEMPVQFPDGIIAEHKHTREAAGLFDVSHMGQVRLNGPDPAAALEALVPGDLQALDVGRTRYSVFTNDEGGILDDLMITRREDHLFLVVNAARKDHDIGHLRSALPSDVEVAPITDRALIALQGPKAVEALGRHVAEAADLGFMSMATLAIGGVDCFVSRSGYTGEDGFEISVPNDEAERIARLLLDDPSVRPVGLGARDSLRLEAGLCLYGHDIDETTSPVEAGLSWVIGKRRRQDGGFAGAEVILKQLENGVSRKRVGIKPEGRAPAREGTKINDANGKEIGHVTSGGFGPSVGGPVAMGYVAIDHAKPETQVSLVVRGKDLAAKVAKLPFIKPGYAGK